MSITMRRVRAAWPRAAALCALTVLGLGVAAGPAAAATATIEYIEPADGGLNLIVSLEGVPEGVAPDLGTVTVTFNGDPLPATASSLSDSDGAVRRTTVLAIDVSDSMAGERFRQAKAAAQAFLDNVPSDVEVGIVTFASKVKVEKRPTTDIESLRSVLDDLELSRSTLLYAGLMKAVQVSGDEGARRILLLSDGRNTTSTSLSAAIRSVKRANVKVDVVSLGQNTDDTALLRRLARAGGGTLLNADPDALIDAFTDEAQSLAEQVLVEVEAPPEVAGEEGTIEVTLQVDGTPTRDGAFVAVPGERVTGGGVVAKPSGIDAIEIPRELMFAGVAATGLAVFLVAVTAFAPATSGKQDAIDRSIEAYTRKGARKLAEANRSPSQDSPSMGQHAIAVAQGLLDGRQGLEGRLGDRLDAAGLSLKPAEWLLLHAGIAVGAGLAALLLGGGSLLLLLGGLFVGALGPWLFLSVKRTRRLKAFKNQLADTLQLMAGSLSAGLSLAQSVDTVVREGANPIAGEFRRALVETRLGVEIEDALMGISERMGSVDFEWIVMAIRIQREVGGNLAELLNKVAETIREREYLERQVLTLSAEGRLSVWILGGLPPAFMAYLALANPSYIGPMFTTPLGWVMLIVMGILLTAGIIWMKRVVKVEV